MEDWKNFIEKSSYSEMKSLSARVNNTIPRYKAIDKLLPAGKGFERAVWRLFFRMGAKVFNNKNELKLDLSSMPAAHQKTLQIDNFFIMRDGYVFFIECKETTKTSNVSASNLIRKDLAGWSHNQKLINKRFRTIFKRKGWKVIHVIATNGYTWKSQDIKKLEKNKFILLRNEEIEYFTGCYENSKSSWFTFNQFLGTFRKERDDFSIGKQKKVVAIRTRTDLNQNELDESKQTFVYTTSMEVKDLLRISSVSHHSGAKIYDLGLNIKSSYQRILTAKRLNRKTGIPAFIEATNKPFINNILINYRGVKPLYDQWETFESKGEGRGGEISFLKMSPGMFHLIDGQHRLFGYCPLFEENEESDFGKHELIVTIFDNLSGLEEAKLFLDINKKQEKINANLVLEIEQLSGADGSNTLQISNISKAVVDHLKIDVTSPFHKPKAIKETQKVTDIYGEVSKTGMLTTLGVKKYIQESSLISRRDNDFTTGLAFKKGIDITDQFIKTIENVKKIYLDYFLQIRNAKPSLWEKTTNKGIESNNLQMASNIPIGGLQLLLNHLVQEEISSQGKDITKAIQKHINVLTAGIKGLSSKDEDDLFNSGKYGGSAPRLFYYNLLEKFFSSLITSRLQKEIDKSKISFNKKSILLVIDPKTEQENKVLREIISKKGVSAQAVALRDLFANNLDPFFKQLYGEHYWVQFFGTITDQKISDIFDKARKEFIKRKQQIKGQPEEKDLDKRPMILWVEWVQWKELLAYIFNKGVSLDTHLSNQCKNSDEFDTKYKKDVKNVIRDIFFIAKNIKQNDTNETLKWMSVTARTRVFASHSDKFFKPTDIETAAFEDIKSDVLKVIDKLRDFKL